MTAPDPVFRDALGELRRLTKSSETRPLVSVLVRLAAVNKVGARAIVQNELRTKSQRMKAVRDAAEAIRAAAGGPKAAE